MGRLVDLGGEDEKEPGIKNGLSFFDLFVLLCDRSLEEKNVVLFSSI